jgi:hypothetical protein
LVWDRTFLSNLLKILVTEESKVLIIKKITKLKKRGPKGQRPPDTRRRRRKTDQTSKLSLPLNK